MGEATYYLKICFDTTERANEVLPKIKELFEEGIGAYNFWQRNRAMEQENRRKEFWSRFKLKFPLVYEYTGNLAEGNCHQMVGLLDFGDSEWQVDRDMQLHENEIWYSAWVWHRADWDPLIAFLKDRFGALKGGWVSEKFCEPVEDPILRDRSCFSHVQMV